MILTNYRGKREVDGGLNEGLNEGLTTVKEISEKKDGGSQKSSQKIVDCMKENSDITIQELVVKIGISDRAVKKQISRLKSQRVIARIGPDKGGYWEIVK